MKSLLRRKSKMTAPALVRFTKAPDEKGKSQLAVFAQCQYGGGVSGPIWSHTSAAVRRCLAELTKKCGCGRKFHKLRFVEGFRMMAADR